MIPLEGLEAHLATIKQRIIDDVRDRALFAAAISMKGEMIDRVFNRGEDSDGGQIGQYSTEPAYFTKEQFIRKGAFKGQGKGTDGSPVRGKKKDGSTRQSMYLKEGYREFRDIQGRQTAKKDYRLSGSLEKSIQAVRIDETSVAVAITDERESKKRKGLEAQDNKPVFAPSKTDIEGFEFAMKDELEHLRHTLGTGL